MIILPNQLQTQKRYWRKFLNYYKNNIPNYQITKSPFAIRQFVCAIVFFCLFTFLPLYLFTFTPVSYPQTNQKTPTIDTLIKNIKNAYKNLSSYFTVVDEGGFDTFSKEKQKKATAQFSKDAPIGVPHVENEIKDKPVFKKGVYEYEFMKPYLVQMKIIKSDYVPGLLYGIVITYRPDNDSKIFWAKLKFMPFAISREIDIYSGGFLTMNIGTDIIGLEQYILNAKNISIEDDSIENKECYLITIENNIKKDSDVKILKPDYKFYEIPETVEPVIEDGLNGFKQTKFPVVKYWIDKSNFLIVKREEYRDGKLFYGKRFKDLKLNYLTKEDF